MIAPCTPETGPLWCALRDAVVEAIAERWNLTSFDHLMRCTSAQIVEFMDDVRGRAAGSGLAEFRAVSDVVLLRALYVMPDVWGSPLDLREERI